MAERFVERYRSLQGAQKRAGGVPAYTLFVNRPLGRGIAAASPSWISPNGLTVLGGIISYAALTVLWFAPLSPTIGVAAGLALVVSYAIDSADGQLSRLRRTPSALGEWLDHVIDAGRIVLVHFTAGVLLLRIAEVRWVIVWAAAYAVAAVLTYCGGLLFDKVTAGISDGVVKRSEFSLLRSVLMLPVDFGVLCWAFVLLVWPTIFLGVYVALATLNVVFAGLYLSQWAKRLASY